MKKMIEMFIKFILITYILVILWFVPFAFFAGYKTYLYFHYTIDGYKLVEFGESFPEGTWVQAKFVVIGMHKEEGLIFNIPSEKLEEFETQLKQEMKNSQLMENPQWNIYQLRVVTTKGRYSIAAFIAEDRILFDTWMSENLKKSLYEWGYVERNKK